MHQFRVQNSERGERLQKFLHRRLQGRVSLRQIKRWLDERRCRVGGRIERFAKRPVEFGMVVDLWLGERKREKVRCLFEDEWLAAYDKPAGVSFDAVAPLGSPVHRLDKDTSGVLLVAKQDVAKTALELLFRERRVFKRYLAVVHGCPVHHRGTIETRIDRVGERAGQPIWGESSRGKIAVTRYQVLSKKPRTSLIACVLETGRTHQIRVHLASLGCPVVGDAQYGRKVVRADLGRHLLHAHRLVLDHPFTAKKMQFDSDPPREFRQ